MIKPGATTGDIGHAIQTYVEAQHMSVVRDFCGHGLGRLFHDEPNIVHVGRPGEGIVLKPGMFFTVEPMINLGRPHVKVLSDGWTAVTRDRSLSAQFEHSVGVTETGVEIFTLSPKGYHQAALRRVRPLGLHHAASRICITSSGERIGCGLVRTQIFCIAASAIFAKLFALDTDRRATSSAVQASRSTSAIASAAATSGRPKASAISCCLAAVARSL